MVCFLTSSDSTASIGLGNGGSAGLLYTNLATWIGFMAVYASLGEQGSMAPTSGGELLSLVFFWVLLLIEDQANIIGSRNSPLEDTRSS